MFDPSDLDLDSLSAITGLNERAPEIRAARKALGRRDGFTSDGYFFVGFHREREPVELTVPIPVRDPRKPLANPQIASAFLRRIGGR